jgi:hypothetical protein
VVAHCSHLAPRDEFPLTEPDEYIAIEPTAPLPLRPQVPDGSGPPASRGIGTYQKSQRLILQRLAKLMLSCVARFVPAIGAVVCCPMKCGCCWSGQRKREVVQPGRASSRNEFDCASLKQQAPAGPGHVARADRPWITSRSKPRSPGGAASMQYARSVWTSPLRGYASFWYAVEVAITHRPRGRKLRALHNTTAV